MIHILTLDTNIKFYVDYLSTYISLKYEKTFHHERHDSFEPFVFHQGALETYT